MHESIIFTCCCFGNSPLFQGIGWFLSPLAVWPGTRWIIPLHVSQEQNATASPALQYLPFLGLRRQLVVTLQEKMRSQVSLQQRVFASLIQHVFLAARFLWLSEYTAPLVWCLIIMKSSQRHFKWCLKSKRIESMVHIIKRQQYQELETRTHVTMTTMA